MRLSDSDTSKEIRWSFGIALTIIFLGWALNNFDEQEIKQSIFDAILAFGVTFGGVLFALRLNRKENSDIETDLFARNLPALIIEAGHNIEKAKEIQDNVSENVLYFCNFFIETSNRTLHSPLTYKYLNEDFIYTLYRYKNEIENINVVYVNANKDFQARQGHLGGEILSQIKRISENIQKLGYLLQVQCDLHTPVFDDPKVGPSQKDRPILKILNNLDKHKIEDLKKWVQETSTLNEVQKKKLKSDYWKGFRS